MNWLACGSTHFRKAPSSTTKIKTAFTDRCQSWAESSTTRPTTNKTKRRLLIGKRSLKLQDKLSYNPPADVSPSGQMH
jgi:hypothetical protein